jgi:hypothetical protein
LYVNRNRIRGLLLVLVSSFAVAATGVATAAVSSGSEGQADAQARAAEVTALRKAVVRHRAAAWHLQRVMGKRRQPTNFMERKTTNVAHLAFLKKIWRQRAAQARKRSKRPPHRRAWLCIHRHEGRWTDPNAPYYGGLQMSMQFQRAFGRYLLRRKGTADRWTPEEQMWTAERALRAGLGFHPWPNTARRCGLL